MLMIPEELKERKIRITNQAEFDLVIYKLEELGLKWWIHEDKSYRDYSQYLFTYDTGDFCGANGEGVFDDSDKVELTVDVLLTYTSRAPIEPIELNPETITMLDSLDNLISL